MVSVIILTYNEEIHIKRAIESVKGFATDVFVVDSYSSDRTVEISKEAGATVFQHPFVNQAKQFQWAIDNVPARSGWLMRLDADEVIEPDLVEEIKAALKEPASDITAFNLKRKHIFLDRWVRFGGRYPLVLLRIWRKGCGRVEDRWMDEHIVVENGRAITLNGGFADHNLNDITFFTAKHNKYATREAIDVLMRKYQLGATDSAVSHNGVASQAGMKRVLKERLYNVLPLWCGPLFYFLYRYIFLLGFLDGVEGLIYHALQGLWYRFLVAARIFELEKSLAPVQGKAQKKAELERLTGFKLD